MLWCQVYSVRYMVSSTHCQVYVVMCMVSTIHFLVYNVRFIMFGILIVWGTLSCTMWCQVCSVRFVMSNIESIRFSVSRDLLLTWHGSRVNWCASSDLLRWLGVCLPLAGSISTNWGSMILKWTFGEEKTLR